MQRVPILKFPREKNIIDPKEKYYRRLEFEHELINHRITWLLTSQSLLFAAYSFIRNKEADEMKLLLNTISCVGPAISFLVLLGIISAYLAKCYARKTYRTESNDTKEPLGVNTRVTYLGFISEAMLPVVFIIGWFIILLNKK